MTTFHKAFVCVHQRWMIRRDLPDVLAIEAAAYADPGDETFFVDCLHCKSMVCMVAEFGDEIAGFMIYKLHRRFYETVDFAVAPRFRRQGVGVQMLRKLVAKAEQGGRYRVRADVHERSLTAQLFLRSQGFRAARMLPRRYQGDDGIRFLYNVPGSPNTVPEVLS